MIGIVDYGVGNLQNLQNALDFLGIDSFLVKHPQEFAQANKIILPGVGAFAHCMKKLQERNFKKALIEKVQAGMPTLGICVGMQMLFEESFENGTHKGLELINGKVVQLKTEYKVPQMGWNKVNFNRNLEGLPNVGWFYFVHSYHCLLEDSSIELGYTDYGQNITSIIQKENIWGSQFHPEKSQEHGILFLDYFARKS